MIGLYMSNINNNNKNHRIIEVKPIFLNDLYQKKKHAWPLLDNLKLLWFSSVVILVPQTNCIIIVRELSTLKVSPSSAHCFCKISRKTVPLPRGYMVYLPTGSCSYVIVWVQISSEKVWLDGPRDGIQFNEVVHKVPLSHYEIRFGDLA